MKRVFAFVSIFLLLQSFGARAFQKPVEIAKINETSIWADEFLYAFKKNRDPKAPVNKDSLLNYLERFINFKLKVKAARDRGIDTLLSFRQEYESYAGQVAKPYLDDPNKEETLIKEAHERAQQEVRAAHILIRRPRNATPKDTLKAWQKIDSLRTLAVNGTSFELLARKNSEDGSAQKGGDLGWFTAFSMIYPFETAAYNTEKGSISPIVKTQFGYHILKVTGKRPANGRIKTSHIFIARMRHSQEEGERLIKTIYDSLQNGGKWNALCQTFSEDERSKAQNGALPMAGIGQLPAEYLEEAFKVQKVNTYDPPVETPYGWHIIRLDAREPVASLNEVRTLFADKVKRSGRLQYGKNEVLKKLKQDNGFSANSDALNHILSELKQKKRNIDSFDYQSDMRLFQLTGKTVYVEDFLAYLKNAKLNPNSDYLNTYSKFEEETIFAYEDSVALIRYPEYRLLLQEYEEGLLLFEIMEDEIWNKALEDSVGLSNYYSKNRAAYPVPKRADTYVISARSNNGVKHLKKVQDILESNKSFKSDLDSLLKTAMQPTEYSLLKIAKRTLTLEDLPIFASGKPTENQPVFSENGNELYLITAILPKGLYSLNEIKGRVTADYQDFLDALWIKKLRKENKVKIYKKRIESLLPLE